MQRGLVTNTNDPSTSNQMLHTWYHSVVDGMIILCAQQFAQLPTILTCMMLTVMHTLELATYSMRWQRPTISSRTILFHDSCLHPSLIHTLSSLFQAMRTRFYRLVLDTEDDGDGLQDPPFPVKPFYFMIPTFIHALFRISRAYFRQCAHVSIVGCRAKWMMMVDYNGILFQDDEWVIQRLGQYWIVPALRFHRNTSGTQKKGEIKLLIRR